MYDYNWLYVYTVYREIYYIIDRVFTHEWHLLLSWIPSTPSHQVGIISTARIPDCTGAHVLPGKHFPVWNAHFDCVVLHNFQLHPHTLKRNMRNCSSYSTCLMSISTLWHCSPSESTLLDQWHLSCKLADSFSVVTAGVSVTLEAVFDVSFSCNDFQRLPKGAQTETFFTTAHTDPKSIPPDEGWLRLQIWWLSRKNRQTLWLSQYRTASKETCSASSPH